MNNSYHFQFNAFSSPLYVIAALLAIPLMMFTEYLVSITFVIILMGSFLLLCRRNYLIIDETGILKRRILGSDEFMSWDDIGDYRSSVIKGSGKNAYEGFAIVGKSEIFINHDEKQKSVKYNENFHEIFIPKNYILGSNEAVEEALRSSIDYYVRQTGRAKLLNRAAWDDDTYPKWLPFVAGLLAVIGLAILSIYVVTAYNDIVYGEYGDQVRNTLVNGEAFTENFSQIILYLLTVLALLYLPILLMKKKYLLFYLLLALSFSYPVWFYLNIQPQAELILQNCSQPTSAPVEIVEGKVNALYKRKRSFTEFAFMYDYQRYVVRGNYLHNCHVGMPIQVFIQKGSKGMPIVRDILIDDISWSKKKGYFVQRIENKNNKNTAAKKTDEKRSRQSVSEKERLRRENNRKYRWKTPHTKDWQQQTLIVDGVGKGTWTTLESTSVDDFGTRKLGMVLAIDESKKRVAFIICEEAPEGGYSCYHVDIKPTISVWFDNDHEHFTLRKDPAERATWFLGERDVPGFIGKIRPAYNITLTVNKIVSVRYFVRKDFSFLVGQNTP